MGILERSGVGLDRTGNGSIVNGRAGYDEALGCEWSWLKHEMHDARNGLEQRNGCDSGDALSDIHQQ